MHTINLPYKQGYVTPVHAAVVVNTYEFREAEDPSLKYFEESLSTVRLKYITLFTFVQMDHLYFHRKT